MSKSDNTENKKLVDLSKNVLCGSCYKEFTTVDSDQNVKSLAIYEGLFTFWQNVEPTWANILSYFGKF